MKRMISLALVMTLLSGCATMDDRQTTQAQGAGFGAVAGAVIGGLIGGLGADKGSRTDAAIGGAVLGGIIGGLGGAAYGTHVANRKAEYASSEAYYEACIVQAIKVRSETQQLNLALQKDLDALDQRSAQLLAEIEGGKNRKSELNDLRKQGQIRLADAQKAMDKLTVELKLQREVLEEERKTNPNSSQLAKLQETVQELEDQRIQLQQRTQRLASINNRMSV